MDSEETSSDVIYRPVVGFPAYRVGDDGSVWSRWLYQTRPLTLGHEWKRLAVIVPKHGYAVVNLVRNGERFKIRRVHQLVLESFVGPCPDGEEVRHFPDRDKTKNQLANLSYGSRIQNAEDKRIHGTIARGERHGQSVLTEAMVREIKRRLASGERQKDISAALNIKKCRVSHVATGRDWAWVQ